MKGNSDFSGLKVSVNTKKPVSWNIFIKLVNKMIVYLLHLTTTTLRTEEIGCECGLADRTVLPKC